MWHIPAEEDRKERRRKLGLPEELTEEDKAAERARAAESAKAKPTIGLPVKPISLLQQLRNCLVCSTYSLHHLTFFCLKPLAQ